MKHSTNIMLMLKTLLKKPVFLALLLLLTAPAAANALPYTIQQVYECALGQINENPRCQIPHEKRPYQVGAQPLCIKECQTNIILSIMTKKTKAVFKNNYYQAEPIKTCIPESETPQLIADKFSRWFEANKATEAEKNFDLEIGRIAETLYPCTGGY